MQNQKFLFKLNILSKKNLISADHVMHCPQISEQLSATWEQGTCPKNELISKVVKPEAAIQAMKEWAAAPGKVFRILVEFD